MSYVVKQSEKVFTEKQFVKMAEKKEHTKGLQLAKKVYDLALECVPAISRSRSLEIAVESCNYVLRSTQTSTDAIITQMRLLAKELPEYDMVRSMPGIGDTLAPRLIAEIGDIEDLRCKKFDSLCRDRCTTVSIRTIRRYSKTYFKKRIC